MVIKILQINAQRSIAVAADLKCKTQSNIDVMVLQEPYSLKGKVKGYASVDARVIQPISECPQVAIIVLNKDIDVMRIMSTSHVISVCLTVESGDYYIIAAYMQFSDEVEPYLTELENMINKIGANKRIIICADCNSHSTAWFSSYTDARGERVEEFIASNSLILVNEMNNTTTYDSQTGRTNIDITLASTSIYKKIQKWCVLPNYTFSDHNAILFQISDINQSSRISIKDEKVYNIKKANWDVFADKVREFFNDEIKLRLKTDKPEIAVSIFTDNLQKVCDTSISIKSKKRITKAVPWWTPELGRLRRQVMTARKCLRETRKGGNTEQIEDANIKYRNIRNKYVKNIRQNKCKSWKNFITNEGNLDPWGIVYKIMRNKLKRSDLYYAVNKNNNLMISWEDTMKHLMDKIVPNDEHLNSEEIIPINKIIKRYHQCNLENEIICPEINIAVKRIKNKKAPGPDKFNPEVIVHLWKTDREILYNLFNNCFRCCCFPSVWKMARVKLILKNEDKDPADINSYRPIALLSVVGKLYERILVNRIQSQYEQTALNSSLQFGFKKGMSTDDAVLRLVEIVQNTEQKYAVVVFIDIAGAFDNIWWPAIMIRLIDIGCSGQILETMKHYFSNRNMQIKSKYKEINKYMAKGCPQGSVMGPYVWSWCMDPLLKEMEKLEEKGICAVAYADDLAIVIKGNSRVEIESKSETAMRVTENWCNKYKLCVSSTKTQAILIKGSFHKYRLPNIKIHSKKIKYADEIKYLGLTIDKKLNFVSHIKTVRDKINKLTNMIGKVVNEKWGLNKRIIKILYKCVYLPIILYGAAVWFPKIRGTQNDRNLKAIQRRLLLMMIPVCRTVSTDAMQIIAGELPLDLEIVKRAILFNVRKNKHITWDTYRYEPQEEQPELKEENKRLNNVIMNNWQMRWDTSNHGKTTKKFIHSVEYATRNEWFKPNTQCINLITGYGPINASLFVRGGTDDPRCPFCKEEEETVQHIIFDCLQYENYRYERIIEIRDKNLPWTEFIKNKDEFMRFSRYANEIINTRRNISSYN